MISPIFYRHCSHVSDGVLRRAFAVEGKERVVRLQVQMPSMVQLIKKEKDRADAQSQAIGLRRLSRTETHATTSAQRKKQG